MMERKGLTRSLLLGGALLMGGFVFSGCQLTENGQTLPSAYYLDNQIQYHRSGNEFQYQKEVDLLKKEQAERELSRQGQYNP